MSCPDCLNNCNGEIIGDKCVEITSDYSLLEICSGDSQAMFNTAIYDYVTKITDGTGIKVEGLIDCGFVSSIHGTAGKSLKEILQTVYTGLCSLSTSVGVLNTQVNSSYAFNTSCLTGITSTSTRDAILQGVINKACSTATEVADIKADYVKASQLCSLVAACITPVSTPVVPNYKDRMVPYTILPYEGPLSNFDNTGKGIATLGFDKVYLCNGLNGTRDWRGRSPIGAVQNVPGGTLDSQVDPNIPANIGTNYTIHQKVGTANSILTITNLAPHTHVVNDPGHDHDEKVPGSIGDHAGGGAGYDRPNGIETNKTSKSVTGITLASTGAGAPFTNVQPSIGCYYIIYLP